MLGRAAGGYRAPRGLGGVRAAGGWKRVGERAQEREGGGACRTQHSRAGPVCLLTVLASISLAS